MNAVLRDRHDEAQAVLRQQAYPLDDPSDYAPLLELVGEAHFVLLGEASHGTREFYAERSRITRALIEKKGFTAVAVEADWPDAYRVNRFVRGESRDATAIDSLGDFKRFPAWMWRNTVVLDFIGWLRAHNDARPASAGKVGFYGLDLYSLHASMEAVLGYLDRVDPGAAGRARYRYACFEHFGEDPQAYGHVASFDLTRSCEDEVVSQLVELRRAAASYARLDGRVALDEYFAAEQNARLVRNAEAYYRAMFHGRVSSWNLRDSHMVETLDALFDHLQRTDGRAKVIVWAHNSHLGDARATEMGARGELNVGQLVRVRRGRDAVLVGFATHSGTVTAASDWGGPAERKTLRPAREDSYEALLHQVGLGRFLLDLHAAPVAAVLRPPRLQRAVGVIYRPESERLSHYFDAVLPQQFDIMLDFDRTHAVEPLERSAQWERGELPETYPTGV